MKIRLAGGAGYIGSAVVPPVVDKNIFQFSTEDLKGFAPVLFLAGLSNDPMAVSILSFKPRHSNASITDDLVVHRGEFADFDNRSLEGDARR